MNQSRRIIGVRGPQIPHLPVLPVKPSHRRPDRTPLGRSQILQLLGRKIILSQTVKKLANLLPETSRRQSLRQVIRPGKRLTLTQPVPLQQLANQHILLRTTQKLRSLSQSRQITGSLAPQQQVKSISLPGPHRRRRHRSSQPLHELLPKTSSRKTRRRQHQQTRLRLARLQISPRLLQKLVGLTATGRPQQQPNPSGLLPLTF